MFGYGQAYPRHDRRQALCSEHEPTAKEWIDIKHSLALGSQASLARWWSNKALRWPWCLLLRASCCAGWTAGQQGAGFFTAALWSTVGLVASTDKDRRRSLVSGLMEGTGIGNYTSVPPRRFDSPEIDNLVAFGSSR